MLRLIDFGKCVGINPTVMCVASASHVRPSDNWSGTVFCKTWAAYVWYYIKLNVWLKSRGEKPWIFLPPDKRRWERAWNAFACGGEDVGTVQWLQGICGARNCTINNCVALKERNT